MLRYSNILKFSHGHGVSKVKCSARIEDHTC